MTDRSDSPDRTQRTTQDTLFADYRAELTMRPEARARTLRRLQERLARGEMPRPESDVPPPSAAAVHGLSLSGVQLGFAAAATIGLAVSVVQWLYMPATGPLRAPAPVVRQSEAPPPIAAAAEARPLLAAPEDLMLAAGPAETTEAAVRVAAPAETSRSTAPITKRWAMSKSKLSRTAAGPSAHLKLSAAATATPLPETSSGEAVADPTLPDASSGAKSAARSRQDTVPMSPVSEPPQGPDEPTPPSAAASSTTNSARAQAAPIVDTLQRELQLLQDAQLALRAGHAERALALLAEHTWTFPDGALAEARDVARIEALCKAGHVEQSKQYAKRFLQRRPSSPFAQRVRAGCGP